MKFKIRMGAYSYGNGARRQNNCINIFIIEANGFLVLKKLIREKSHD